MAEKREKTYSGRDVSQGYTVLKTPLRRAVFFGGLIGLVVLAVALALA